VAGVNGVTTYDDPKYPCGYCVGWVEPDPADPEKSYPIHADGRRVRRMYRFIHPTCDEMVWEYERTRDRL
jgi:hypothetical protein